MSRFHEKLMDEATKEFAIWGERPIVLETDLTTIMAMIGALQLALRHPGFAARPSALKAREFIAGIEQQIPPEFPAIRKMIQLGFHQRFDT